MNQVIDDQEQATTKVRVVYDGSAKLNESGLSLNNCLQTGLNLIPKLFNVLVKFRSYSLLFFSNLICQKTGFHQKAQGLHEGASQSTKKKKVQQRPENTRQNNNKYKVQYKNKNTH